MDIFHRNKQELVRFFLVESDSNINRLVRLLYSRVLISENTITMRHMLSCRVGQHDSWRTLHDSYERGNHPVVDDLENALKSCLGDEKRETKILENFCDVLIEVYQSNPWSRLGSLWWLLMNDLIAGKDHIILG